MDRNRYQQPERMSREDAEAAIGGADSNTRISGIWSIALHDPDWRWVQAALVGLLADPDPGVVIVAIQALGHLARLHGQLDLDVVVPALDRLFADPRFIGAVEDATDDIDIYVRRQSEHEDGLRRMVSDAHGTSYRAFRSLEEARGAEDGIVVMQGDDGGSIYLTCPVHLVRCNEAALGRLLLDLDRYIWNDPDSAAMFFEQAPVGSGIAGGTGGSSVIAGVWLHPKLEQKQLRPAVEAVLADRRKRIN
jgi:hypothetical protein